MKKIIINGRFLTQRITGVQRYAREIMGELDKIIDKDSIMLAIPGGTKNIPSYRNIKTVYVGRLKNQLWEQISFPLYVKRMRGISVNLCNSSPLLSPDIVCIHDVKIKAKPEYFSKKFSYWYRILFLNETKRAKKIITVSQFSKSELMKYYHVKDEKIVVISNAWQHFERILNDENALNKYHLEKDKYFFALGSLEPNKNIRWIVKAAIDNPDYTFAIAGSINSKVFSEGFGFACPENVKLLGYVSDEEAKTLMRDCYAFLFPSIYEGYGIPPLEAMSAGAKRLMVSDIEVMHEIFEDSVHYINVENNKCILRYFDAIDCTNNILEKYAWSLSAEMLLQAIQSN